MIKKKNFFFFCCCGPLLKSLLNLLQYCFCFTFQCFGLRHVGSYLPDQGLNRRPLLWEAEIFCFGR